jgi:transcriptional repressor NrdR
MVEIKKRNGAMEQFIPEKIIVSAIKSGARPEDARKMAKDIEETIKAGTTTEEIRGRVLGMLRTKNPVFEQNWRTYDQAVKKRS